MELQVTIKNHYGKDFIYPHCKQSEVFAILTRKKTLTENFWNDPLDVLNLMRFKSFQHILNSRNDNYIMVDLTQEEKLNLEYMNFAKQLDDKPEMLK